MRGEYESEGGVGESRIAYENEIENLRVVGVGVRGPPCGGSCVASDSHHSLSHHSHADSDLLSRTHPSLTYSPRIANGRAVNSPARALITRPLIDPIPRTNRSCGRSLGAVR